MGKSYARILFAFVVFIFYSCSQPKELLYQDVKNFRIGKLSLEEPEIGMDLQFYNPNAYGLTLKDADIDVYINDNLIGKAALSSTFAVPALDTFLMPVALTASLKNIFPNALQIVFNKEVDVKLQGTVKAGRGLFLTIPISYHGRQKLNVF